MHTGMLLQMKRVNDIFYSLQGEGRNTGRAAIFIRFAGCNLKCPFCDTDFSQYEEMSDEDILNRIKSYSSHFVVLTGGEPSLQVDRHLVNLLHSHGYELAMEYPPDSRRHRLDNMFTQRQHRHQAMQRTEVYL